MQKTLLAIIAAAVVAIGLTGTFAIATHAPADKVVAAGDSMTVVNEGADQTILSARIKTSKPTDLMLHVAAECAVETRHVRDGKVSSNDAEGFARVWIEVDGKIVPIQSASAPPQDPAAQPEGGENDKVTFCHRAEGYDKTDNNATCVGEMPPTLTGCETEEWFQNTKTANAFNWVRLNTGSGNHLIEVKADVVENSAASSPDTSDAEAYIGNRTLIVEPTKMSVDTLVAPAGSS